MDEQESARAERGLAIGLAEIESAREVLAGISVETPMDESRWLSVMCGGRVWLKCEHLQRTGSFKARGAYTRMSRLSQAERDCESMFFCGRN